VAAAADDVIVHSDADRLRHLDFAPETRRYFLLSRRSTER
jgi:hypothetical protein